MSKHSSQLSSPHHLSTHRLLPDVSLVPEEVCLHGTLSWNRPRLTSACMAIPHYSTWHTNERHTQETIARKLPRNCDAHITPKPLNMASISLILRACTQPNPRAAAASGMMLQGSSRRISWRMGMTEANMSLKLQYMHNQCKIGTASAARARRLHPRHG